MAVGDKTKKQKKQINKNYRLAVMEENSYQEKFALSLSIRNIFLISSSIAFVIILITSLLIFYTPIREYIPGYDTTKIRIQAVQNLDKLDSIMNSLEKNEQFIKAFSRTINGQDFLNQYENSKIKELDITDLEVSISIEDSILRKIVEVEDKFNIIETEDDFQAPNLISPASGIISEGFDFGKQHYGVDIVLKERTPIKAVYDGIVLFSEWTLNSGYTVVVFHKNELISTYKHNQSVKVETGDFVQTGEVIALSGNTGEFTSGPHLHFELWDLQGPINPEDLIKF
ncbi:MAG: peptidase M23 [Euryarchaeota archaeon]|nr:peptidase M23 [Euryarchaeota archaeon]